MLSYLTSFIGPTGSGLYIFLLSFPLVILFTHIALKKFIVSLPQKIGIYLFFLFLTIDIGLVFFPFPEITPSFCLSHSDVTHWRFIPFQFLADIATYAENNQLHWINYFLYNQSFLQVIFNFFLILPLGFLGSLVFKWKFRKTLIYSFFLTVIFEILQWSALLWILDCPYRFFDIDDIMMNIAWAIVWWAITLPFRKDMFHWMKEKENKIKKNNHFIRRLFAFSIDISLSKIVSLYLVSSIATLSFSQNIATIISDFFIYFIYFVLVAYTFHGKTLGKYLFWLKVSTKEEKRPSITQLFIRSIPIIFILPLLDIGFLIFQNVTWITIQNWYENTLYLTIIFIILPLTIELSRDGRWLHDHIANTKIESKNTGLYKLYKKIFDEE